jgi:hypothetical protein
MELLADLMLILINSLYLLSIMSFTKTLGAFIVNTLFSIRKADKEPIQVLKLTSVNSAFKIVVILFQT